MVSAQINRLQKDSSQLELFINKLKSSGDHDRAVKITEKKDFLDNRIAEMTN